MNSPNSPPSSRAPDFALAGALVLLALAISPLGIRLATGRFDLSPRITILGLIFDAALLVVAAGIVSRGRLQQVLFWALAAILPVVLVALAEAGAIALHLADRVAPLEDLSILANKDGWPRHFMSAARKVKTDGVELYRPWHSDGIVINELGLRTAPPTPKRRGEWRIAMTGASVAFGWRLRDADTIPVQLQEILHRQGFSDVTVYNFAIDSVVIADELALLQRFRETYAIDQVVFLTGANDVMLAYMSATAPPDHGSALSGINQFELLKLVGRLDALWFGPSAASLSQLDTAIIPAIARDNSLRDGVTAADQYCRAAALRCDLVLQPSLLRRKTPSGPEIRIDRTLRSAYPRYDQVYATMYRIALGAAQTVHDSSDVFDRSNEPYFIDIAHLNERGSRVLAERIAGIVSRAIPRSDEAGNGRH